MSALVGCGQSVSARVTYRHGYQIGRGRGRHLGGQALIWRDRHAVADEDYCKPPRKILPAILGAPVSSTLPAPHDPLTLLTSPDCTSLRSIPTVTVPPVIVSRAPEV